MSTKIFYIVPIKKLAIGHNYLIMSKVNGVESHLKGVPCRRNEYEEEIETPWKKILTAEEADKWAAYLNQMDEYGLINWKWGCPEFKH
jgi:hypothetical protein